VQIYSKILNQQKKNGKCEIRNYGNNNVAMEHLFGKTWHSLPQKVVILTAKRHKACPLRKCKSTKSIRAVETGIYSRFSARFSLLTIKLLNLGFHRNSQ
jgi:hypothetical protein